MPPKKRKKKIDDDLFPNPLMQDSNSDVIFPEDLPADPIEDDTNFDGFDSGTSDGGGASGEYENDVSNNS